MCVSCARSYRGKWQVHPLVALANKHALARCHAAESSQAQVKACLMPMKAMTNREQAELYVDKVGKNLNPSGDPQSGLHSFDNPAAGLPPGY